MRQGPPAAAPEDGANTRRCKIESKELPFPYLEIDGEIDVANAPDILAQSLKLLNDGANLILDLGPVSYLDSAGLSMLIRLTREIESRKGRLAVVRPLNPSAFRIFEITGLVKTLHFFDNADAAGAYLTSEAGS